MTSGDSAIKLMLLALGLATSSAGVSGAINGAPRSVEEIAAFIRSTSEPTNSAAMRGYTNQIPGATVEYAMVPVPGGEFLMGNPIGGPDARSDESPAHRVRVEPFWIGRCEVTWNEYKLFVYDELDEPNAAPSGNRSATDADAVTYPTLPYVAIDHGMGMNGFPAIGMTQYAANKYCQWLSARTGHFYRLPTEAEWEYAARAGSTNTWGFGVVVTNLGDYAWFEANSNDRYQKVGRKLPNAWGLHDMLGNVSEWVMDQFDVHYYEACAARGLVSEPWNRATNLHPRVVRGGSWRDGLDNVRNAARVPSTAEWNTTDPNFPKSKYWMRDCDFVGFRIVRPFNFPSVEEMRRCWNGGVEATKTN